MKVPGAITAMKRYDEIRPRRRGDAEAHGDKRGKREMNSGTICGPAPTVRSAPDRREIRHTQIREESRRNFVCGSQACPPRKRGRATIRVIRCPCFSVKSVVAWTCLPHVRDLFWDRAQRSSASTKKGPRPDACDFVRSAGRGLELTPTRLATG